MLLYQGWADIQPEGPRWVIDLNERVGQVVETNPSMRIRGYLNILTEEIFFKHVVPGPQFVHFCIIAIYSHTLCILSSVNLVFLIMLHVCLYVHRLVYLQDLAAILLDVLQLEAFSLLWVTVLLQVALSGFHLRGEQLH